MPEGIVAASAHPAHVDLNGEQDLVLLCDGRGRSDQLEIGLDHRRAAQRERQDLARRAASARARPPAPAPSARSTGSAGLRCWPRPTARDPSGPVAAPGPRDRAVRTTPPGTPARWSAAAHPRTAGRSRDRGRWSRGSARRAALRGRPARAPPVLGSRPGIRRPGSGERNLSRRLSFRQPERRNDRRPLLDGATADRRDRDRHGDGERERRRQRSGGARRLIQRDDREHRRPTPRIAAWPARTGPRIPRRSSGPNI